MRVRDGVALAALALALVGCGSGAGSASDAPLTIYVSLPLSGARAEEGRAIARGAREALADAGGRAGEHPIRLVVLDDTGGGRRWNPVATAENARRATEDSAAIAYIGELDSGATRTSLPITNEAGILQVSPGATAIDLTRTPPTGEPDPDRYRPSGEQTFVRLVAPRGTAAATPAPPAAYGREAMELILDAIAAAGDSLGREEIVDIVLDTGPRDSPLGTYSIDPRGDIVFEGAGG